MTRSNSSKGQLGLEVAWIMIVLTILALGLIYGYSAFKELNDDLQSDISFAPEAKAAAEATVANFPSNMDNMFFFFFIMLWVFLVIVSFFASTHPVFIVISIVLIVLGLVGVMFVANAYNEAMEDDTISAFASEFPKITWIMEHILLMMVMVGFSVMMVLYARSRG